MIFENKREIKESLPEKEPRRTGAQARWISQSTPPMIGHFKKLSRWRKIPPHLFWRLQSVSSSDHLELLISAHLRGLLPADVYLPPNLQDEKQV